MNNTPRGLSDIRQAAERLKAHVANIQAQRASMNEDERRQEAEWGAPEPAEGSGICESNCPVCAGIGWVRVEAHPRSVFFGRLQPCPRISAQTRAKITDTFTGLQYHELDELKWSVIFDNAGAQDVALRVQQVIRRGYGLVYLHGDVGLAKTLILKCAVAEAVRAGKDAAFAPMADILDEIRECYRVASNGEDPRESAAERLARWTEIPLLAIDELGRTADTAWVGEKVFQLLNRRHERAIWRQGVTLLASNLPPEKHDRALYDRIRDGRHLIIRVDGESARPMMGQEDRF